MGNLFCFVLICVGGAVVLLNNLCPFHQEGGEKGGARFDLLYHFLLSSIEVQVTFLLPIFIYYI